MIRDTFHTERLVNEDFTACEVEVQSCNFTFGFAFSAVRFYILSYVNFCGR